MRRIATLFASLLAVAAPIFATGLPVSSARIDVMSSFPSAPSIVQGGTDRAMVVWSAVEEQTIAIYASETILRLGTADDFARRVGETSELVQPLVAATSKGDLVVWHDRDGIHGVSVEPANSTYYLAQPIIANAQPLAIATSNGKTLLVFLSQSGAAWSLGAAFLTARGEIESTITLGTFATPLRVALTAAADGFLLAYAEEASSNPLFVRRIGAPEVSDVVQIGTAGATDRIAIAASPTSALVVWPGAPSGDLIARHVDLSGNPVGAVFATTGGAQPALTWTGTEYLLTYTDAFLNVRGDLIGETSVAVDRQIDIASGPDVEGSSGVASDGQTTSVVWLRTPAGAYVTYAVAIEAVAVNRAGDVSPSPTLISHAFTQQDEPSAANAGGVSLVAWTEQTGLGSRAVFVARVDGVHYAPDGVGIWLGNGSIQRAPSVASNGDEFLVVWIEDDVSGNSRIIGQRVAKDGSLLGGRIEMSLTESRIPEVRGIWSGEEYVAVWTTNSFGGANAGVTIARVLPTGVVRGRSFVPYDAAQLPIRNVAVAAGRSGALLTSDNEQGLCVCPPRTNQLFALAIDRSGNAAGPPVAIANDASRASVAALGDRYLVVWSGSEGLAGEYLNENAIPVSSPFVIHPWSAWHSPSIFSDGTGFVVAADIGNFAHLPILATIRGANTVGISLVNEGSPRVDPMASIIASPDGIRAVFRQFDADWMQTARIFTNTIPNRGVVDVATDLDLPENAAAGSTTRITVHLTNRGTQTATNVGVLFGVEQNLVAAVPDGCEADRFRTQVVCRLNELVPGAQAWFPIDIALSSDLAVRAATYAAEQDGVLANNVTSATVSVKAPPARRRTIRK